MMRYRSKVLALSVAIVALLAIWALGLVFSPLSVEARSEMGSLLRGTVAEAASVELGGAGSVSLARQNDSWFFVDASRRFPAQSKRVEDFLKALSDVKSLKPLAHSTSAWAGLGLDEGKAKSILVKDASGRTMADLRVGGYGPTGSDIYIRRIGSNESYAVDSSFAAYLDYGRSGWLDLRVMPQLPATDVQSISVNADLPLDGPHMPHLKLDYRLTRAGQGWTGLIGGVEASTADTMVRSVLAIEAADYVAAPPSDAFEPVTARVELNLGAGGSKVLEIGRPIVMPAPATSASPSSPAGAAPENRFYARLAGSPYIFAMSAYSLRAALKTPAQLLPKK
ncbi:MAG: DUF4340 domain-containing protein [Treponema sp.]|nr:DUF4340 domain-containing protein [Treponema sp.]